MVDSIGAAAATSGPADPSQVQQGLVEPAADAQPAPPDPAVSIPPAGEEPPPKPPAQDEKRWLERDDVIRRVARARAAQIEASNQGEPEGEPPPAEPAPVAPPPPPAPATPAAAPIPAPAEAADTLLTVKIDDEEFQVPRDKVRASLGADAESMPDGLLVKNFQILAASQKRLAEARFIKRQAMEAAPAAPPAPAAPAAPEPAPATGDKPTDEERAALRQAVERIQLGTVDEGVDAFLSVLDNVKKGRETIGAEDVARIASETARRQADVSNWQRDNKEQMRLVAEKHKDVWTDQKLQPNVANRAAQLMTADLQRIGYTAEQLAPLTPEKIGEAHAYHRFRGQARPIGEIFDQACNDIRADFSERFKAPAPTPPLDTAPPSLAAKQAAKDAMPPLPTPAARAHALPEQPKRKTPTEVVNEMRRARQLPVAPAA